MVRWSTWRRVSGMGVGTKAATDHHGLRRRPVQGNGFMVDFWGAFLEKKLEWVGSAPRGAILEWGECSTWSNLGGAFPLC